MTTNDGRRLFFVDENLGERTAATLRTHFRGTLFRTAKNLHILGEADVHMIPRLAEEGFDGIITRDTRQLVNADERDALRRAGLHWVGVDSFGNRRGSAVRREPLRVNAATIATLTLGLPLVFETWANSPTAYHLVPKPVGLVGELTTHAI